jgi:hypothetical protein
VARRVSVVTDEERFGLIQNHLKVVAEVLATFEAAVEDEIKIKQEPALRLLREAMDHCQLAYSDASSGTGEVDALGI